MEHPEGLLSQAETIARLLHQHGVPTLVIGGVALAAHHYIRHTEDLDLAVVADLPTLRRIAVELRGLGFRVELREPDVEDPLGGVIDVESGQGLVQIISYGGRFPAVIEDAIRATTHLLRADSPLRLVPMPHLIALKLYAGGHKSKADIVELLLRNPGVDVPEIRALCDRYRLPGLEELLREAGLGGPNDPA
jgi:hypothetical protein